MLVRCNVGCKLSDGMTDASLDVDSDSAICNECGESLEGVSSYAKLSMRKNGDILRSKNKKAFMFGCKTCDKTVEATFNKGILVGKDCPNDMGGCKIDTTSHMVHAIAEISRVSKILDKNLDNEDDE